MLQEITHRHPQPAPKGSQVPQEAGVDRLENRMRYGSSTCAPSQSWGRFVGTGLRVSGTGPGRTVPEHWFSDMQALLRCLKPSISFQILLTDFIVNICFINSVINYSDVQYVIKLQC